MEIIIFDAEAGVNIFGFDRVVGQEQYLAVTGW